MSGFSGVSAYTLTDIFRLFDTDNSESIDIDEMKHLLRVLLKLRTRSTREPDLAQVNGIMDILRPRLARFCAKKSGSLDLTEFLSAIRAESTLAGGLEWMSATTADFFAPQNFEVLNFEFPFEPTFDKTELREWQTLPAALECSLPLDGQRKQACIPNRNWQVALRIAPALYPPDGRSVQVKVNRTDSVADVLRRVSQEWPGLRGRDFHPPAAEALQLRVGGGRVYLPDESVGAIGYLFKTPGFLVEPAERSGGHEYRSAPDAAASASSHAPAAAGSAASAHGASAAGAHSSSSSTGSTSSSSSAPPAAMLQCSDRLWDIRTALHAEADRHRRAVERLEASLDDQSDALSLCAASLGGRFQADKEDLKQQIGGLRGEIGACRRGWVEV